MSFYHLRIKVRIKPRKAADHSVDTASSFYRAHRTFPGEVVLPATLSAYHRDISQADKSSFTASRYVYRIIACSHVLNDSIIPHSRNPKKRALDGLRFSPLALTHANTHSQGRARQRTVSQSTRAEKIGVSDSAKTRREREEAILKDYQPHDIDILASALMAAHRREDAIRALKRFDMEEIFGRNLYGECASSIEKVYREVGNLIDVDEVLAILDGDK